MELEDVDLCIGMTQGLKLFSAEWKSGDIIWLMDILAPFGGGDQMIQELRQGKLAGQKIKSLQPAPGGGMGVVEW